MIIEDNKVLLTQYSAPYNKDVDGKWSFPGGVIEFGESPDLAAVRETFEEVGLEIEILGKTPIVKTIKSNPQLVLLFYLSKRITGTPKICSDEVKSLAWFSVEQLKEIELMSVTAEVVRESFDSLN